MALIASLRLTLLISVFLVVHAEPPGPPQIDKTSQTHYSVFDGTRLFRLVCAVTRGRKDSFISWRKDGAPISPAWTRYKVSDNGATLKIRDASREDAGVFTCKAVNGFGAAMQNYTIRILERPNVDPASESPQNGEPPLIVTQGGNLKVNAGGKLRIRCQAQGKPRPSIRWFKDNEIFDDKASNRKKRTSSITIKKATRREHEGTYTCMAVNALGSMNVTFDVKVVDQAQPKPEMTVPHPVNMTVNLGDKTSFLCKVKSEMEPTIRWLRKISPKDKDKYNNTIEFQGQAFVVLTTGKPWLSPEKTYVSKLQIERATKQHQGLYTCMGANINGFNYQQVYLNVKMSKHIRRGSSEKSERVNEGDDSIAPTMPIIIAIPTAVVVLVAAAAIFFLYRRCRWRTSNQRNCPPGCKSTPANNTARGTGYPIPPRYKFAPVADRDQWHVYAEQFNSYPSELYPPQHSAHSAVPANSDPKQYHPYQQSLVRYEYS